jgi:microcystin degradation protein MlrC
VIVTSRGDEAAARTLAADIADRAWAMHERFQKNLTPLGTAVTMAVANGTDADRPAQIFADVADNPGGGGTGATTTLLQALVEAGADGVVMGVLCDPALAERAHDAGEGASFTAVFNEVPVTEFDQRFEAPARVAKLASGHFVGRRGLLAGRAIDLGPAALLEIGGVRVAVATNRKQCADPAMLEIFGIDIAEARTVVVKSRGHFRAGFDEFFGPDQVVEVDCPGLVSPVLGNFPWRDLVRPVFPLDQDATWDGPPW